MKYLEFTKDKYGFELLMDLYQFEKNAELFFIEDYHTTNFYEIMFFEKGIGKIEIHDTIVDIKDNSAFFFFPGQQKRCFIQKETVKGFHLVFQNEFLGNFFSDKLFTYRLQYFHTILRPFHTFLSNDVFAFLSNLLSEILTEIKDYKRDSQHILRSILYYLLTRINREYSTQNNISDIVEGNNKAYEFKQLLEKNILKITKVKDYSNLMGVSRVYLNSLIKKQFGISVSEMITNSLLLEIKSRLTHTSQDISEIAHCLNFSEPNNLTRFFKNQTGLTPKEYRISYPFDRNII